MIKLDHNWIRSYKASCNKHYVVDSRQIPQELTNSSTNIHSTEYSWPSSLHFWISHSSFLRPSSLESLALHKVVSKKSHMANVKNHRMYYEVCLLLWQAWQHHTTMSAGVFVAAACRVIFLLWLAFAVLCVVHLFGTLLYACTKKIVLQEKLHKKLNVLHL